LAYELLEAATTYGPGPALERSLELHGIYPGFGHYEFAEGDPRADLLIDMVRRTSPADPVLMTAHDVIAVARAHANAYPNIDMALAVIALANDMPPTAGEVILTVARTAGWLAHALEEYDEPPARFRAKALPRA
jgi:citrate synthase